MLFNTIDFAIFLPIVFVLYWFVTNKHLYVQNALIVVASYVFYGWWDWRFLTLIFFSTLVDYTVGRGLNRFNKITIRRALLWISIGVNIGLLGVFKYFNFFIDNFSSVFSFFGTSINIGSLNIVLPVGISFYTFQTLSYTIDVYKRKLEPTSSFLAFSAYVSFFPQLVAGPIERATHLLPQFYQPRVFNYKSAVDGLRQILWGLFKKMVIADSCAEYANLIFNNSIDYNGSTLFLGALFFSFQIYGDFSGYSDIAIGVSRLLGFNLMRNFAYPYFSRDIAEFWRRWHISLSTWFRDYLYIPLGGSKGHKLNKIRNVFIIFIVSGFWHGANWTFIVWGLLNAIYFLPLLLSNKNRDNLDIVAKGKYLPSLKELILITSTFLLTLFAWIFFRANSISHALSYISEMFSSSLFEMPVYDGLRNSIVVITLVVIFVFIEWIGREKQYAIEGIELKMSLVPRWSLYLAIVFMVFYFQGDKQEFIYFQF